MKMLRKSDCWKTNYLRWMQRGGWSMNFDMGMVAVVVLLHFTLDFVDIHKETRMASRIHTVWSYCHGDHNFIGHNRVAIFILGISY